MKYWNKITVFLILTGLVRTSPAASTLEKQLQKLRDVGIPTTIEELNLPEIPDEENGALVYREAFKLLDSLRGKYKEEWDCIDGFDRIQRITIRWDKIPKEKKKKVTDLILHNPEFAKFYQLLEKASQMECGFISREGYQKLYQPVDELEFFSQSQGVIRHLSWLRACARAIKKKMQIEAEYGEIDKVLSTFLIGFKIGKSLSNEFFLPSHWTRKAIEELALNTLEEVIDKGNGNIELYQSLINEMEKERKDNLTYTGMKGNIIIFRLYLFSQYRKAGKKTFEFTEEDKKKIEKMAKYLFRSEEDRKKILEERIRNQKKALNEAYLKSGCKNPETFFDEQELFYLKTMSKTIPLTKGPYWEVKDNLEKIYKEIKETSEKAILTQWHGGLSKKGYLIEVKFDALLGAAEIGIANRIYRQKHGKYVDSLEQLTPETLSSLPLDPFTGKNYIYKRKDKGFIVYSVAENLTDDGGVEKGTSAKPDIVWENSGEV